MGGDTTKHVNYTILGQKAHLLQAGLHIFCISNQICGKHHLLQVSHSALNYRKQSNAVMEFHYLCNMNTSAQNTIKRVFGMYGEVGTSQLGCRVSTLGDQN